MYKSIAWPSSHWKLRTTAAKIVTPNQSMSLQEILERFTRNEPVPVGKQVAYHESDDDLEKVATMDLVDKAEYVEALKQTKVRYDQQEKRKAAAEKKRLEEKLKAEIMAEQAKNAAEGSAK